MKEFINIISDPPILFTLLVILLALSLKYPRVFWSVKSMVIVGVTSVLFFV
ncbi:MAG: hypothetical protein IH880_03065, partial [Candidatus Marinimicrobia bacterium]|nr:hypothetical protein [Candidatus Neomarinimicrobiota bacterium]